MNEFVAYYKNFFVNFRNDQKKLKKKIKGEKRTKRRRIQLILTHTHKVIEEIDCTKSVSHIQHTHTHFFKITISFTID